MESNQEKYRYEKLLESLCKSLDGIIDNNTFKEAKYKKNISAISAFLEFLKSGASVSTSFNGTDKVDFIIEME